MATYILPDAIETMHRKRSDWKTWLINGDKYMEAATPKRGTSRFNNEIRYNLLSLSLESYVMAILDFHRQLPDNHTYTDLMTALDRVIPVPESLKSRILHYENIQSICSLEKYHRTSPSGEELIDLTAAIQEIGKIAHGTCSEPLMTEASSSITR